MHRTSALTRCHRREAAQRFPSGADNGPRAYVAVSRSTSVQWAHRAEGGMNRARYIWLVLRALWGFASYDIVLRLFGFAYMQRQVRNWSPAPSAVSRSGHGVLRCRPTGNLPLLETSALPAALRLRGPPAAQERDRGQAGRWLPPRAVLFPRLGGGGWPHRERLARLPEITDFIFAVTIESPICNRKFKLPCSICARWTGARPPKRSSGMAASTTAPTFSSAWALRWPQRARTPRSRPRLTTVGARTGWCT